MRLGLVTRSLLYGGTERQLVELACGLHDRGHRVSVLQLYADDDFGGELDAAGVARATVGVRSRLDLPKLARQAFAWRRAHRPDVLHGFHVESNLLVLLLGRSSPGSRVVWGVRVDDPSTLARDWPARAAARVQTGLLRAPDLVVANSHAGARWALAAGAASERVRVVSNGVDTNVFRDDPDGRVRVRDDWRIKPGETVVGTVARLEPRKGPELFLRAAAAFAAIRPDARFVWVGAGEHTYEAELRELARDLGIADRLVWAGGRLDIPAVHSALDLETLLSPVGEGSSNSIAEALACERPCVVSDTGDLARVVGDQGIVISALEPSAVAAGWEEGLRLSTAKTRKAGRAWIGREFSLTRMLDEYEAALVSLL